MYMNRKKGPYPKMMKTPYRIRFERLPAFVIHRPCGYPKNVARHWQRKATRVF